MPWKVQDGSVRAGEMVANRRPLHCYLDACLALDSAILTFDLFLPLNRMITCSEQAIELWNLEDYKVVERLGVNGAFTHKGLVRDCSFNRQGTHFVTASEDSKIFLWHFEKKKGIHKMCGHLGPVFHVMFSDDDKFLYSSSVDGKICMWDWEKNNLMYSFLRHPAAVHTFHFSEECPERLASGCDDGSIRIWDMKRMKEMDIILPNEERKELDITIEKGDHHNGAITCVEFSPHSMVLASGSLDGTCKLWNVVSYSKSPDLLKEENEKANSIKLDRMINVFEEDLNIKDQELFVGEVGFPSSYHADLFATLEHEGPVTCLSFSPMADLVTTGSLDCTCRIWNAGTGVLLFQINVPSPICKLHIDDDYVLTCICQNRVLVFQIKIALRESDLPTAYLSKPLDVEESEYHLKRISRIKNTVQRFDVIHSIQAAQATETEAKITTDGLVEKRLSKDGGRAKSLEKMSSTAMALVDTIVSPVPRTGSPRKIIVKIDELRKLMAHGSISPTALYSILEDYDAVKKSAVVRNIEACNISSMQVLRMISANKFPTESILKALEDKSSAQIIGVLINKGAPIADFLEKLGMKSKSRQEQHDDYELLNREDIIGEGKPFVTEIPSYEDENLEVARMSSPMDKSRIVHFSPAETLRMMRDMASPSPDLKAKVNPFFVRQIQSNTSNNLRTQMNHFRASMAENPDDPNSTMSIKRLKYGETQGKLPRNFVSSMNIDDTSKYQSGKDALNVISYGKKVTAGRQNNGVFNPGQYGEGSKGHEDPFIFETRALAKYDKMILSRPTRRFHAPAAPQNLRFNDITTFQNTVFKNKKSGTLFKRFTSQPPRAVYYDPNPSFVLDNARSMDAKKRPGNTRFNETSIGAGRQRGSLGLSNYLTARSLLNNGTKAPGGVGKVTNKAKSGTLIKPIQNVFTQKLLLKQTPDNYFQQVLIGRNALNPADEDY